MEDRPVRFAPADYAAPSILASFLASSILAQAAGSGSNTPSISNSGTDIIPYVVGAGAGAGLGMEYL